MSHISVRSLAAPAARVEIALVNNTILSCTVALLMLTLVSCFRFRDTSKTGDDTRVSRSMMLHYETYGDGPPILFLHGFGASSYTWNKVVKPLSQTNKLILLDLKGHGQSPKPADKAYSLQAQSELVLAVIREHNLRDLTIVGHSLGGGVALLTALQLQSGATNPLSALILIDTVAYSQPLPLFIRVLRLPIIGLVLPAVLPTEMQVRHILKLAFWDDKKITDHMIAAYSAPLAQPGSRKALVETARQMIPSNIDEIAASYPMITTPTLILWGSHDEIVPIDVGKRLHAAISNSKFVVVEHSGHIPHEEVPESVLLEIRQFLSSSRASQF
jgi:pimeloyl-ACP methyl ester carboxylesterase